MFFQRLMALAQIAAIGVWLLIFIPVFADLARNPDIWLIMLFIAVLVGAFFFGSVLMFLRRPLGRKLCIMVYALQVLSVKGFGASYQMAMPIMLGPSIEFPGTIGFSASLAANISVAYAQVPEAAVIGINIFAIYMIWRLATGYHFHTDTPDIDAKLFE